MNSLRFAPDGCTRLVLLPAEIDELIILFMLAGLTAPSARSTPSATDSATPAGSAPRI